MLIGSIAPARILSRPGELPTGRAKEQKGAFAFFLTFRVGEMSYNSGVRNPVGIPVNFPHSTVSNSSEGETHHAYTPILAHLWPNLVSRHCCLDSCWQCFRDHRKSGLRFPRPAGRRESKCRSGGGCR